jgi:N-acetylmuramoyl-L-alanine amidase
VRRRAALLLVVATLLLGLERPPGLGDVTDVRHWSYDDYTRVVVELSRAVQPDVHRLPAGAGHPQRLYLDLGETWVGRRYGEPIPVGDGLLHAVRLGQNTLRRTRVVIDLERYTHHRLLLLPSPPRVVIDVFGPGPADAGPSDRAQSAADGERSRLAPELRPVRTVVIDPGHGGRDPGAVGVGPLEEKEVTLRLARALAPRLESRGFRVVLTRSDDATLSLEERTAIAEGEGGDVFVSLHANAARRRSAQGIETYYLDATHERHTLRLAALENGVAPRHLDELQRTLAALRVSAVSKQSAALAGEVHRALLAGLRSRWEVTDLGVKRGPFYVLFLSSMPAILVETGFLTNAPESRRLGTPEYVNRTAERIAEGIARYRARRAVRLAGRPS